MAPVTAPEVEPSVQTHALRVAQGRRDDGCVGLRSAAWLEDLNCKNFCYHQLAASSGQGSDAAKYEFLHLLNRVALMCDY